MRFLHKSLAALVAAGLISTAPVAHADDAPGLKAARLARDLDGLEGVRAVKKLQGSYAQYFQYGLWDQMAALFADNGVASFGSDDL